MQFLNVFLIVVGVASAHPWAMDANQIQALAGAGSPIEARQARPTTYAPHYFDQVVCCCSGSHFYILQPCRGGIRAKT